MNCWLLFPVFHILRLLNFLHKLIVLYCKYQWNKYEKRYIIKNTGETFLIKLKVSVQISLWDAYFCFFLCIVIIYKKNGQTKTYHVCFLEIGKQNSFLRLFLDKLAGLWYYNKLLSYDKKGFYRFCAGRRGKKMRYSPYRFIYQLMQNNSMRWGCLWYIR